MATFAETMFADAGLPVLIATHGVSATYTAPDGTDSTLTVMVRGKRADELDGNDGRESRSVCRIAGGRDPAADAGGLAAVYLGGVFTVAGESWAVEGIERDNGAVFEVRCRRREAMEVSRRGYRLTR